MSRRMLLFVPVFALVAACAARPTVQTTRGVLDYPMELRKNLIFQCTKLVWPTDPTQVSRRQPVQFEVSAHCEAKGQLEIDDSQDPLFEQGNRTIPIPPSGQTMRITLTVRANAETRKYKVNLKLNGTNKDPDFEVMP